MTRIKSRDNRSTELKFRAALSRAGVGGWTIQPEMYGHPDIAFIPAQVAVFLDGCFWHGCEKHFRAPKTNAQTWVKKIKANIARDARVLSELIRDQWKVFRIWEHDIADEPTLKGIVLRVARAADTPDEFTFGKPLALSYTGPVIHRSLGGITKGHPLSSAGSFFTSWRGGLFDESEGD
jgi:DNA mismatch endonuclease (patch repair protein)